MKRIALVLLALVLIGGMVFAGGGGQQQGAAATWEPTRTVEWTLMGPPGGGTDILTRNVVDIIRKTGVSKANFVVSNVTEGNGEVARVKVARSTGTQAAHMLLGFSSGDLNPMKDGGNTSMDSFSPIAVLASEKHVLLVHKSSKYRSIEDIVKAIANGEKISAAGARGDDEFLCYKLCEALGVSNEQLAFVAVTGKSDSIPLVLGGHVDLCINVYASTRGYVESGDLIPIAAFATERFTMPIYDGAPTLSELGYENIEFPIWRAVFGSVNMPKEAVDYYINMFKALYETPEFEQFLIDIRCNRMDYFGEDARPFILETQKVLAGG